ncbi:MAG: hypothetical protein K2K91_03770 [Ruminococcus sp.]|nr:hypothetical protein [Ruminococcus sp.]MDE7097542.1 hypothetical protein [Ruminococcus sp.]
MLNSIFTVAAQGMETPQLFPFPLPLHIGFSIIALVFFLFRFITDKKPYQLIMAIAVPLSLALELSDNRTLYYVVGIVEFILLLSAFITTFFFKDAETAEETEINTNNEEQE